MPKASHGKLKNILANLLVSKFILFKIELQVPCNIRAEEKE